MAVFRTCISAAYAIMQTHVYVFDYTLTLWQIFLFFGVAGCLLELFFGMMK